MKELHRIAGIGRQALWKYRQVREREADIASEVIEHMEEARKEHKRMGCRKAYYFGDEVSVGRDRFEAIALEQGYRIRQKKTVKRTTWSQRVEVHPNRIEGLFLNGPDQVWQSDIFYLAIEGEAFYGIEIIDVHTRVLLALHISRTLKARENVLALNKAFAFREGVDLRGCVHHSDRGSQYISKVLKALLLQKGMVISMGVQAEENAYAERVQGTLEHEYFYENDIGKEEVGRWGDRFQYLYNEERPHRSLNMRTPKSFEREVLKMPKKERPEMLLHQGYAKFREE
jgi:transposase InsO family protein